MPNPAPAALAALLLAASLPVAAARAAQPEKQVLAVTNATDRVAYCTLIFDGRARTELAIHPGKTWSEAFDPRRRLQLVCQRGKANAFGPLTPGATYRLVPSGSRIDIAEGGAE